MSNSSDLRSDNFSWRSASSQIAARTSTGILMSSFSSAALTESIETLSGGS